VIEAFGDDRGNTEKSSNMRHKGVDFDVLAPWLSASSRAVRRAYNAPLSRLRLVKAAASAEES
jgi:hypothetical protein